MTTSIIAKLNRSDQLKDKQLHIKSFITFDVQYFLVELTKILVNYIPKLLDYGSLNMCKLTIRTDHKYRKA